MKYEVIGSKDTAVLQVRLDEGETFKAESGAMVAKSSTIQMESTTDGGALKALKRSFLGGGSFFFQGLRAVGGKGEALIAPPAPGEIGLIEIGQEEQFFHPDCFLAAFGAVDLNTRLMPNTPGLITGEGLFAMCATGSGTIALGALGSLIELVIPENGDYIVDLGHLVAWQSTHPYTIEKVSNSWFSSLTSGEAMVCRFTGPAKVHLQSRSPHAFSHWVKRMTGPG